MAKAAVRGDAGVPAQLSFLTIYNPSLGNTDETLYEQVLYFYSRKTRSRRKRRDEGEEGQILPGEEKNEQLRQIGLAQGTVEFARAFSNGEAVDSVETEKSRIVIHELETGWWILASIDLTRLAVHNQKKPAIESGTATANVEYSAREVCPPALLLQQLQRAHSIFLLHHGISYEEIYNRIGRPKFCGALDRFWTKFALNWDVLLHGNPAVDIFPATKLALGGGLGIGVGEEEWGSGEREVLEGLVKRVDGLVDLVVSRFGVPPDDTAPASSTMDRSSSHNRSDQGPTAAATDGVIFSGVEAISRTSLRAVADWTEWLHSYGEHSYGVRDNPDSALRKRQRKPPARGDSIDNRLMGSQSQSPSTKAGSSSGQGQPPAPQIPPPIVSTSQSRQKADGEGKASRGLKEDNIDQKGQRGALPKTPISGSETLMKYLTLGYGSRWGASTHKTDAQPSDSLDSRSATHAGTRNESQTDGMDETLKKHQSRQGKSKGVGYFMIGLQGDLETDEDTDEDANMSRSGSEGDGVIHNWNNRLLPRTLHVEISLRDGSERELTTDKERFVFDPMNTPAGATFREVDGTPANRYRKLRVVVYKYSPFFFTFLFELRTPSLTMPSFYRALHHQLGPLQRPLLISTSPTNVSQRIQDAAVTSPTSSKPSQPIYDLIYDPTTLTIHSSIPNIPDTSAASASGDAPPSDPWTRMEALNVHTQILSTYALTRRHDADLERTCKTSRGWWVVWTRLRMPQQATSDSDDGAAYREAFLVRKASDYMAPRSLGRAAGLRDLGGASTSGGSWAPGKMAEGIGIDTKKYIEGLLSLNR